MKGNSEYQRETPRVKALHMAKYKQLVEEGDSDKALDYVIQNNMSAEEVTEAIRNIKNNF